MSRLSKIGAACLAAFGWTGISTVTASYLVVAGGGGGGGILTNGSGGGGGAGGFLTGTTSLNPTLSYTVTVGAGGTASVSGSNSVFNSITSTGGGAGAEVSGNSAAIGGSGGGGSGQSGGTSSGAAGTSGQGNAGGNGGIVSTTRGGGGGGGASAAGANQNSGTGASGAGGAGTASSISGSSVTYAGGGGGGGTTGGAGGAGGGANGASSGTSPALSGTANTGGGGGGGDQSSATRYGGAGGSGIVIISYAGVQQFSGGVVTSVGGNTIHTFTTSGTLGPITPITASYLIVAGGGSGANGNASIRFGGGGGAGGLLSGSGLTLDSNSTYLVTVGAGGASQTTANTQGNTGSSSSFSMVSTTAVGGGLSGINSPSSDGGSGGGGSYLGGVTQTPGNGTSGQGNNGGTATSSAGGGGGGAGAVGSNASGGTAGAGGAGSSSSISGTATYYAGGGGGGGSTNGAGGTGGGGAGGGTSGTANTGGGGGGTATNVGSGAGGSGVVIISYPGSTQLLAGGTVTIVGGNVIHTFTSTGYLAPIKYATNSLRFRSSASAYLNRTPASAGNRTTWTWSGWVKRGLLGSGSNYALFGAGTTAPNYGSIRFSSDSLQWFTASGGSGNVVTSQVFRDPAAWYHIVVALDTTQATASNRLKMYVNGVQVTSFSTSTYPSQNYNGEINSTYVHAIGSTYTGTYQELFDGYMTEINFIDGQALTPNSFGTFNSYGVWQPINYGGSYGTNGFYLPFNSNASSYAGYFGGSGYSIVTSATQIVPATGDFTIEAMVNFASLASYPVIAAQGTTGVAGRLNFYVSSSGQVAIGTDAAGYPISAAGVITTNRWYYIAATRSGANTVIYVNGKQVASSSSSIGTVQNTTFKIGVDWGGDYISSGYVSNVRVSNVVRTISPSTAPTSDFSNDANTVLLTLQSSTVVDNSSNAYVLTNNGPVTLGKTYPFAYTVFNDQSPQGNNWTPNNISGVTGVTMDYMTDVPTLTSATVANYAVLNAVNKTLYQPTISDGNLTVTPTTTQYQNVFSTFAPTSGKWYCEVTVNGTANSANMIGVSSATEQNYLTTNAGLVGITSTGYGYYIYNGNKYTNGSASAYGDSIASGNVVGIALDLDNGKVFFSKNGTWQASGDPVAGTNAAFTGLTSSLGFFISSSSYSGGATSFNHNFGQRPFTYTPPTGYVALNTYNL